MTTVRWLPPGSDEVAAVLTALHPGVVAAAPQDQPYEPAPTLSVWCSQVLTPWLGDPVHVVVAEIERVPVGCALVELPSHDNPHVGLLELHVDLAHRRGGVGRALWAGALDRLHAHGRSTVLVEARCGSPMEALAAAMGAQAQLTEVRRHQVLGALDLGRLVGLRRASAQAAQDYRLQAWAGPTPAPLRGPLAAATQALNDAPLGGLDYDDEAWDADRIACRDAALVAAGLRMHTVLALAGDGAPAGFTDVAVSEDGTYAWQWGTGVVPRHRGHRLGMLLKTTMVERLLAVEPAVEVVSTWNAATNTHMVAVNEALGYEPVDRMSEWQLNLAAPGEPERRPAGRVRSPSGGAPTST